MGHRVCYGGGFYDRFLDKNYYKSIAVCYDFQIVDTVEFNEYDKKPDIIVTNSKVLYKTDGIYIEK